MGEYDDLMMLVCASNLRKYCKSHTESCNDCIFAEKLKYQTQCLLKGKYPESWEFSGLKDKMSND